MSYKVFYETLNMAWSGLKRVITHLPTYQLFRILPTFFVTIFPYLNTVKSPWKLA